MKKLLKILSLALSFVLCLSVLACGGGEEGKPNDDPKDEPTAADASVFPLHKPDIFELTFADYFSGSALDSQFWTAETGTKSPDGPDNWGNNEAQFYSESNLTFGNNAMTVTAKKENRGGKAYTSGRITSKGKFSQTYGRFEARLKLPLGQGMWPAFWLLPEPNDYGVWPKSGEIDIMENKGREPRRTTGALHYSSAPDSSIRQLLNVSYTDIGKKDNKTINNFHIYAVEWDEEGISWYVDDALAKRYDYSWWSWGEEHLNKPFDQPFYIILNLAVGGTFDGGIMPVEDFTSAAMEVDFVRVYKYKD